MLKIFIFLFFSTLASCSGVQSIFTPATEETKNIVTIWWVLFGVCLFVFLTVITLLLIGLFRNASINEDKNLLKYLYIATTLTVILLIGTLVLSHQLSPRQNDANKGSPPSFKVEITGFQWWWRIRYFTMNNELLFETANEITIPKEVNVRFELLAGDVIHSFWVPKLAGKIDMIPGRVNTLNIRALEEGIFRGQCAEFCGVQHANMSFSVHVVSASQFKSWKNHQMKPAVSAKRYSRGRRIFAEAGCIKCHSIRNEFERAEIKAPDLTHLGSRKTLAALSLPNNLGHLSAWVTDPQNIKPGNLMPASKLNSKDLLSLLEYLESLK